MDITLAMTVIATIFLVFILGAINSLFSFFLDYCFWDGSIFGSWLPFLAKVNIKFWNKKEWDLLQTQKEHEDYEQMLLDSAERYPFFKILGGCAICTNMWLAFLSFTIVNWQFFHLSNWYVIPYALFSSFVLRRLLK